MNTSRGYACVALENPKYGENVGGVLRASGVYGAKLVIISGKRFTILKKFPTDTMKVWKHIPIVETESILGILPYECVPVAVDILPNAKPLPKFTHPDRACYIFGPEDSTISKEIVDRCRLRVVIPTIHCMNLAATVNVVLYDRLAKRQYTTIN